MAGYYLYTLDNMVFTQLTTSPTKKQGQVLADFLLEELEDLLEESDDGAEASIWPLDRNALAELIVKRLALPDWYSDLSYDDATIWDSVIHSLSDEPGEAIRIGFQCSDYENIYWDCAEIAEEQGATMMAEPRFGSSGYRYFGKPTDDFANYPLYSFFMPDQTQELLAQLDRVEPYFAELSDDSEGSPREQFFEGLLPTVKYAVEKNRILWVQTDT